MEWRWCMRIFITLLLVACFSGCTRSEPDMAPVGGGLAVIGLGMVAAAVIRTLAGKGGDHE